MWVKGVLMKSSRFAVSSQAALQEVGELGVPVRNVALLQHKQNQYLNNHNLDGGVYTS